MHRNVRFGSEADICGATSHVRFAPNSDRESGFPQTVMSALPPKAHMPCDERDVRFVPNADLGNLPYTSRALDKVARKTVLISILTAGRPAMQKGSSEGDRSWPMPSRIR